jgi:hypothetical protein
MRAAQFDVPAAMQHIYNKLERSGFKPRITIAPSEWDHAAQGCWVRFLHVHGEVEVTLRPFGKKNKDAEQKWRISPAHSDLSAFYGWSDAVVAVVRMACRPDE